MTSRKQQGASTYLQNAAYAALLLALVAATGCSSLTVSTADVPPSAPDPAYDGMVANRVKSSFKNYASYEAFEKSDYRWVHFVGGWSWLTCVRFQERGHRRTYAVFLREKDIIENRYAVQADGCDTASYVPFDLTTGAAKPPSTGALEPLY